MKPTETFQYKISFGGIGLKTEYKCFLKVLLLIVVLLAASNLLISTFSNKYINILLILLFSVLTTLIIARLGEGNGIKEIMKHLSNITSLDFAIPEEIKISDEEREEINKVVRSLRDNLKTQVMISTEIFNACENLAVLTKESLLSSELVASSVDIADSNTSQQFHMLRTTNDLTEEINYSMSNIEKDIVDKIQFISNSITSAQKGIETIGDIEIRTKNSKDLVEETSEKITRLENYSAEVENLVELINSISSETKMLSLNASIEAARAGEEGRGFSVVATEVGNLAAETDRVSKKIEEVINLLKNEIADITKSMVEEMKYMDENCKIVEATNKDFLLIVETLNLGKDSLEAIKDVTGQNNAIIGDVTSNIDKITQFSKETTSQMMETTKQTVEQNTRARTLSNVVEKIVENVYNMQQFVAGSAMEEKMLRQAYEARDYFLNNKNVGDKEINKLLKELEIDAIYVTDTSGIVVLTNEKSAMGLDLYNAEPTFLQIRDKKREYVVTPIKKRVEDDKLFKFLTVADDSGRLYDVGLALDSLIKDN